MECRFASCTENATNETTGMCARHLDFAAFEALQSNIDLKRAADRLATPMPIRTMDLYAYVGLDEDGSGLYGLKQGMTSNGLIALVSIYQQKILRFMPFEEEQAKQWGKKIRLCRFQFVEVIAETEAGTDD